MARKPNIAAKPAARKKKPRTVAETAVGETKSTIRTKAARAATARPKRKLLFCSFCRRDSKTVAKLIAGPGIFICDACVGRCNRILAGDLRVDFPGWQALTDDALLQTLKPSHAAVEDVRAQLQQHVEQLRNRDVSWERIGAALGMSRQAAWERFA